jgi:rubrerythrin
VFRSRRDPLLDEMRLALFAEFGALALYSFLSRSRRDPELSDLLAGFRAEEVEQIAKLRALIERLGGRAPRRRRRRDLAAGALYGITRIVGAGLALRLCLESEETVSGWYAGFALHLARVGSLEEARTCESLAVTKRRHALALQAWVER